MKCGTALLDPHIVPSAQHSAISTYERSPNGYATLIAAFLRFFQGSFEAWVCLHA
jgi:hypothetical protein